MSRRDASVQLLDDQGVVITCTGYPEGHAAGQPHAPRFVTQFYRPGFGRNAGRWLATPLVFRDDAGRHQYELSCPDCSLDVQRSVDVMAQWLDAFAAAGRHDIELYVLALHASRSKSR